ncbi:DUF87 domain-containing protein [Candidatus Dojkabacteria bacterium]|nr:DUF87 domain-containing protein [Candidatus Dojkabacteria bacterium]
MGRRRRRRKITYDSRESKIVLGLISLLFAVICVLSNFTDGVAFELALKLFGGAVYPVAGFFLVLALKLFQIKPDRITTRSVIGMLIISISWAIFLSGKTGLPVDVKNLAYQGQYGGIVGFELAEKISTFLFRDAIRPLMIFIIFFSVPLVLSMRLGEYLDMIGSVFGWIFKQLNKLKEAVAKTQNINPEKQESVTHENQTEPTMVGDFLSSQKYSERKQEEQDKNEESVANKGPEFEGVADDEKTEKSVKNPKIKYKKSEENEDLLLHDELQFPDWELPPLDLLKRDGKRKSIKSDIEKNSKIIEQTLKSFNVKAQVVDVSVGPSVTQYALNIALGTKVSKIANLKNDLALALATSSNAVRIEAPIPGTSFVGIEVPNKKRQMILFGDSVGEKEMEKGRLTVTLGEDVGGKKIFIDIQKMPHLLIAGATGSGKSVVTNSFIMSMLMKKTPDEVRMILVDPKQVEFSDYNGIPHLLTPVITNMNKVNNALKWAIVEMENRYTEFKENKVRNIEMYNEKLGFSALPYIVIVIDEMADMMMGQAGAEIESSIVKLAQKARATGIHLILATQRPSVDVITGLIKANIPGRLGLSVTTQIDSRVILDQIGAESLLGRGDLLYKDPGKNRLERIQGTFISQDEVLRVVNFIKRQTPDEVEYTEEITQKQVPPDAPPGTAESIKFSDDELFAKGARIIVNARKGSSSLLQRKLSIGYNRAARLIDEYHKYGIVGPSKGSKPRDILITDIEAFLQGGGQAEDPSSAED